MPAWTELVAVDPNELMHSLLEQHGDVLIHYASPYYDPVKAKEYYERTKQLKGPRQGTASASLSKPSAAPPPPRKPATPVTNAQAERQKLAAQRDAKLKAASERIKKKLEETIAKRADAILKRLENLPDDASPEIVARLMKTHSKNANKARKQAAQELQSQFKSIRSSFKTAREALRAQQTQARATAKLTPGTKSVRS